MGERSTLDRLAIVSVFVAGIVEAAQAALSQSPAVTKAYPVLKLDGLWNYIPLAFIAAATSLWLADQALRVFRPSYAVARSPAEQTPVPPSRRKPIRWAYVGGSIAAIAAMVFLGWAFSNIAGCVKTDEMARKQAIEDKPELKFPPVVRGAVTLAYVRQVIGSQDAPTAEATLAKYLGTPMRVSGTVHSNDFQAQDKFLLRLTEPKAAPQVYLLFDNSSVSTYDRGEHVAAECKIERLDADGLGLDDCHLIPDEAWTGKPEQ